MSLTLEQIRDDLFGKIEIRDSSESTSLYTADALRAVNWALQVMWLSPHYYFKQEENYGIPLIAGTRDYTLDVNIQRVIGNARLSDGTTLAPIDIRADFDNFGLFYGDLSDNDVANGKPVAYFLDRFRAPTNYLTKCVMSVVPTPSINYTMFMDVERECPRYTAFDSTILPVPLQYTEIVFLAIARYAMTRSEAFINETLYAKLQEDYRQALIFLGVSDTTIPEIKQIENK